MALTVVATAVEKDGKVIRPAMYQESVTEPRIERFDERMVDAQIARLTAELAKWTARKQAIVEPKA